MSDDFDDFLAGLDSLASTSILNPLSTPSQSQPVALTSDNIRGSGRAGKKRERASGSIGSPSSPIAPNASSSSLEWPCPSCTFLNPSTDMGCGMCGTRRPEPVVVPPGQWACPLCTCLNTAESAECDVCSCERPPEGAGAAGPEVTNLVCACGCVNKASASKCKRCKASLKNARAADTSRTVTPLMPGGSPITGDSAAAASPSVPNTQLTPLGTAPLDDDLLDEGSESSESDYGSEADSDEEAADPALTTHQVANFMQAIPSVNTEHIAPAVCPRSMTHCGLKDFQLQAVAWMVDREKLSTNNQPYFSMVCKGGLLADYMGLGKTRTIIGLCESTKALRKDRMVSDRVDSAATLIVCPVSVMSQWRDEIRRTVKPCPRVLIYYGAQRKQSIFQVAQEYDYVISSYHSLSYEYSNCPAKKVFRIQWHRIVLDEAHWIRNRGTHIARASNQLNAHRRWVVTATPIQNRLSDLEPLIAFLRLPGFSEHGWWRADMDEQMIKCLQAILSTIMLRRTPDTTINGQRILDLPPKETIVVEEKLPEQEQQFLKDLKNRVNHRLNMARAMDDNIRTYATAFEMLVRCRQACLHRNIVIQSLRAKMGMVGTRDGALAALDAHQRKHQAVLDEAARAEAAAELMAQEAKQKEETAAADQLGAFVKVMQKRLTDCTTSVFVKAVMDRIVDKTAFGEECVICLDTMKNPVLLPCAHIFCKECITACVELQNRCPHCKVKAGPAKFIKIPAAVHGLGGDDDDEAGTASSAAQDKKSKRKQREEEEEVDERAFNRWLEVEPGPLAHWEESDRTRQIRELIQSTADDDCVLVLSSFVTYLRSLEHHLGRAGITTAFMDGSMNPSSRQAVVTRFTQPAGGPKVLLASMGTCGVGLNLTRASLCILAEPGWNPGVEEQAVNRIHRLGQTKPVKIVKFSAKDTIESAMVEICDAKRRLGERLTNSRMTRDDIIAILHRFADATSGADPSSTPAQ